MDQHALCIHSEYISLPMSEWHAHTELIDRKICDSDWYVGSYLQIVPYVVFKEKRTGDYFTYCKPSNLENKNNIRTLGISGHVDSCSDQLGVVDLLFSIIEKQLSDCFGYLLDDLERVCLRDKLHHGEYVLINKNYSDNKFDRTHLGVVIVFDGYFNFIDPDKLKLIKDMRWCRNSELVFNLEKYDSWGQEFIKQHLT